MCGNLFVEIRKKYKTGCKIAVAVVTLLFATVLIGAYRKALQFRYEGVARIRN